MNLLATRSRVESLTKELLRSWEETTAAWRDLKAAEFESNYLQVLTALVEKSGGSIEKLDGLLNKVRSDCE